MAKATIDPRAVVDPGATLAEDVHVGPYCVVGAGAAIGARTRLSAHVVVDGSVTMGEDNVVSPFASLGGPPQDLKYQGEPTKVVIGSGNQIREYVTINRGTVGGGGVTRVGDRCLIMGYVHIAHDCQVGSRIIFANGATLAGHVEVGDDATVGLFCGVHQFTRIAKHAFIGGYSAVSQDALPWIVTAGDRSAEGHGVNVIGLKRKGYPPETIEALKRCYMTLFRSKLLRDEAIEKVERELGDVPEVAYFLDFVKSSKRGVIR